MVSNGDRKGNITATFGSDLIMEGMTSVPNLILKYYPKIGITDSEMMLVIQLIYLQTATNQHFPPLDVLAQYMSGEESKIKADLASLIEKGIINIEHIYSEANDEIIPVYSFEPLFEKVSELWACEKVRVYQQMKKSLKEHDQKNRAVKNRNRQPAFAKVCRAFEKEFGRPLSPMEIEQISLWLDDVDGRPDLILEALKRAVLLGKHNFKYIDSILLEWQKNSLKTITDVLEYEANFRERQIARSARRKPGAAEKKKDKFKLLYLG